MKFNIGDKFHQKNDKRLYHVVAILEEKPDAQVVYKYFGIHKQWWHYEIKSMDDMITHFDIGLFYK